MTAVSGQEADTSERLRALCDAFLRCPTAPALDAVTAALHQYQTGWITERAGADAPVATATAAAPVSGSSRPKLRLSATDQGTLVRLAEGWVPTTRELPRWAWLENHGLVRLEPASPCCDRAGQECVFLTAEGYRAIGRPVPAPRV